VAATAAACLAIAVLTIAGTWVVTMFLYFHPHRIELALGTQEAHLWSLRGVRLHSWESPSGKIHVAEMIRPRDNPDGARLAMLGYNRAHEGAHSGALVVYDLDNSFEDPLWYRAITDDNDSNLLPSHYPRTGYSVAWAEQFDVFAGRPGVEIAVVYNHEPTPESVLRVYSIKGELLYQICHPGPTAPCAWLSVPKLLIVLGSNNEADWPDRGHEDLQGEFPVVLFASQPRLGHIGHRVTSPSPGGDLTTIAWYRCFFPPDAMRAFDGWRFLTPYENADRTVRWEMDLAANTNARVHWLVDEFGNLGDPQHNNAWTGAPEKPAPGEFYLGDLPPIK
jgi:hypothetical protein